MWLSIRNSRTKAGQEVESALPAPVDPWHCRTACLNQEMSGWAHTGSDSVCARLVRPLVGLVGRKCQGRTGRAAELSVAGGDRKSVGWGPAEWLSGLPVPPMIPTKGRGSSAH